MNLKTAVQAIELTENTEITRYYDLLPLELLPFHVEGEQIKTLALLS